MKKIRLSFIIIFSFVLFAALFAACGKTDSDCIHNYGDWSVTLPATCETAGERTRVCLDCDKVETEPIEKLGHDWDEGTETKEATCEDDGVMTYVCNRDAEHTYTESIEKLGHDWKSVEVKVSPTCELPGMQSVACSRCDETQNEQEIPALNHDWEITKTQDATCQHGAEYSYICKRENCNSSKTETTDPVAHNWDKGITVAADCENNGSITRSCTFNCGATDVETLQKLGHQWGSWQTVKEATCEGKGQEKRTCSRTNCNKSETHDTNALGHLWGDVVVDRAPSLEQEGEQSRHCTRSGCNERDSVQTIPKLDKNTPIEYTISVTDPCGDAYKFPFTVQFYVDDTLEKSEEMTTGSAAKFTLGAANYKVKLVGLKAGYTAEAEYNLFATEPQLIIRLDASLIPEQATSPQYYKIGAILNDFEFSYYDPSGELQKSSYKEILQNYKGIMMNFYFHDCPACITEMPSLISAADAYENDVLVLMVNYYGYNDTNAKVLDFQERYNALGHPMWWVCVEDSKPIYRHFGASIINAFPGSVFIDCNGEFVWSHVGALSAGTFKSWMQTFIVDRYDRCHTSTETLNNETGETQIVALLPSKKFD